MKKLLMFLVSSFLLLTTLSSCGNENETLYTNEGKVLQSYEILGTVKRKTPSVSNEGLDRYPLYNQTFDGDLEEKTRILEENKLLNASSTTYDSMDENGNLFLEGNATGRQLYKHSASVGLYGGNVSADEKAVIKKINITPRRLGNYITGLYAPAGEVIKIEISEEDLANTGGFEVWIGNAGNRSSGAAEIPLEKTFSRMPNTVNAMKVNKTTVYVGSYLGGAIYLGEPKNKNASYSVTISGAVEYSHFILGLTTKEEFNRLKDSSAPYFDLEVWDDSIRHSGPKYLLDNMDYDNYYNVAKMWENISLVTNQVPSASADIGISMRYDTYIPAGAAVAFVGANFCVMPLSWFNNSLNYEYFINNGMWGTIHEYNHHYQQYGASEGGEVTNNAVSLLSYMLYTKISSSRSVGSDLSGWNAYTYASFPLNTLLNNQSTDPIHSLETYAVLIHSFGVDTFLKAISLQEEKGNDDSWYKAYSLASGYDLTYYFEELCNYSLSTDVKDYVKSLNYKTFIPVSSIYQTKTTYNEMIDTVRPYEVSYGEEINVNLAESLILPEGYSYRINKIEGNNISTNNNGFVYKTESNDFNQSNIDVNITIYKGSIAIDTVSLIFSFVQKDKKVTTTTYTYSDENMYRNIALAEVNNFSGYDSVKEGYSNSYALNNLNKNTITVSEAKIYIKEKGKYRFYIKGKDNVFMYVSTGGDKKYKLVSYINGNSNYTNDNPSAYYDVESKANSYVYIKVITLSKSDNGYSDLGYGMFDGENVSVTNIPNKYIVDKRDLFDDTTWFVDNHYNRQYFTSNDLIDTKKFEIIDSTNYTPWSEEFELNNMLDGNVNTYTHNNAIFGDELSITIDMKEVKTFNFIELYGKNNAESHVPVTFDLYFGDSVDSLSLYKEYVDLEVNNRSVLVNFDEIVNSRYIKLVIKDTESHRYVAISKFDIGNLIAGSKLISIMNDDVKLSGNWSVTNSEYSNHSNVVYSKNGTIKYEFNGSVIGLYGIALEDTKFKVKIDGQDYQEITVSKGEKLEVIFREILEEGTHKIEIKSMSENLYFVSFFYN